jgi:hypothetical protein
MSIILDTLVGRRGEHIGRNAPLAGGPDLPAATAIGTDGGGRMIRVKYSTLIGATAGEFPNRFRACN